MLERLSKIEKKTTLFPPQRPRPRGQSHANVMGKILWKPKTIKGNTLEKSPSQTIVSRPGIFAGRVQSLTVHDVISKFAFHFITGERQTKMPLTITDI